MDDRKKAKSPQAPVPARKRFLFKLKVFVGLALLLTGGLVAALPWLLGTAPGLALVVGQANARLAPGSIRLEGLGLSWTGPIALEGLALVDPKGKTVLAARRVTLDRGVVGLLASKPDYGTVTIEGATIDLERRGDGTIDLLDALASLTSLSAPASPGPPAVVPPPSQAPAPSPMAVSVVIKGGTLKLASPELVEPFAAGTLDGWLTIAPGKPIEVVATLGDEGRSLEIRSTIDRASSDRSVSIAGKDWPIHIRQSGVEAGGRFEGTLEAKQDQGLWTFRGDAALARFEAGGPALLGDRLAFDRVAASCQVVQGATSWAIRKLELTSPVASIKGEGTIPAMDGTPAQIKGKIDLAALAKALPNAMRLRDGLTLDQGLANVQVDVTTLAGLDRVELLASLDDFAATEAGRPVRLRQPVYLSAKGTRSPAKVTVEALEVKAAGVDVTAGGDLESGVKLNGSIDLVALMAQARDVLDLTGFDLSGHARIAADYRHAGDSFKGRFAAEFKDLKVTGATAEPIAREVVRLDGWAVGPAKSDGTPDGWRQARLDLKAGDVKLDLQANSEGGAMTLTAGFEMAVASPVVGRLDAKAKFRKTGTVLDIDELVAGITPSDPRAATGAVALAVQGRFDSAKGEGEFGPILGQVVGAVGLGPEGAKVSGVGRGDMPLKVDAALVGDLAQVDRLLATWNGTPAKGLGGLWATQWNLSRSVAGQVAFEGKGFVPDLTFASPKGPIALTIKGGYNPEGDRLDLNSLDLATKFGRVTLVGGMVETKGRRLMDLKGTIEPTWATVDPLITASVEPGARVRATAKTLHLAGQLQADTTAQRLNQLFGEVELDLTEAEAFGVTLGQTAVVLKLGGGLAKFDPITTTLNGGPVNLFADLAFDADYGLWLRLGSSRVEGATINEAVSNSILAYIAPVLAKSSGVSGKVTVAIDRAFVPITASGSLALEGAMVLQDVEFKPGPLGDQLTSITGLAAPELKLNEAMTVKVRDGRVQQNGLEVPLGGNGLVVAIDGSVGFDETLDLKATIPLAARVKGLDPASGVSNVSLPIRGTLARPAIDRKALAVALRDAAKAVGEKRIKSEAGRLLERLAGPAPSAGGEPRSKPSAGNPLGDLENLGRELLDKKP